MGAEWATEIDTADPTVPVLRPGDRYPLAGQSVAVLRRVPSMEAPPHAPPGRDFDAS
jgi:hypothetical protein